MKITHKSKQDICFRTVLIGQVFEFDEIMYMRIEDIETCDGDIVNAICLADGEAEQFALDDTIIVRNVELIVE